MEHLLKTELQIIFRDSEYDPFMCLYPLEDQIRCKNECSGGCVEKKYQKGMIRSFNDWRKLRIARIRAREEMRARRKFIDTMRRMNN